MMPSVIAPPPLAELQTLKAVLDLVQDPKAVKKALEGLIAATKEFHEASAVLAEAQAKHQSELQRLTDEFDATLAAKKAEFAELEDKLSNIKATAARMFGL